MTDLTTVAEAGHEPAEDRDVADDLASTALLLARRLHAGATLWCLSPSWPHHARHVAVEFVHPVIVGKRALPAVAVPAHDGRAVDRLRASVRRGDVILAIAPAGDRVVHDVCRRADPWGVTTVWVGAGPRPEAGSADRVLWHEVDDAAAETGRFVRWYHLLWELTHVCLEHAGCLTTEAEKCEGPVCITCSDEGRLAEVVRPGAHDAVVRADGIEETIATGLVGPLQPTDLVLVHAGTAIARVGEPHGEVPT